MRNSDINNEQQNNNDSTIEINLMEILGILGRKWMILLAAGVVAAIAAFAYFHFAVTPLYTSNARIMVINRQNSDSITNTDLTSSTTLSNDYVEIVTSRSVLEQVIADLELDMSVEALRDKVTASVVNNTRMININVTDADPILAKQITDSISTVTSNKICDVMNIENMVSIVDEGSLPTSPSSPDTVRNTVLGALIGVVIAAAVIIVRGIFDDRIKTQEDIEKYLGVSVLGTIPMFENNDASKNSKGKKMQTTKTVKERQPEAPVKGDLK